MGRDATAGPAQRWRIFLGCEIDGVRHRATELLEPVATWLTGAGVTSCTVTPSSGFVDGQAEETLVIEVLSSAGHDAELRSVIEALRAEFRQDAVLWTRDDVVRGMETR